MKARAFYCALLVSCGALAHDNGAHTVYSLEQKLWYELLPKDGSLLGKSFRVLANDDALRWLNGKSDRLEHVEFLKLILTVPTDVSDKKWENARIESAQYKAGEWKFYGFGPVRNVAESATPRPPSSCSGCHQRGNFRNEPLFLSLYFDPRKSVVRSTVKVNDLGAVRVLTISKVSP